MEELLQNVIHSLLYLTGIPLLAITGVSFVVSVLQAATQIQDQTVATVPKLLTAVGVLIILAPEVMRELTNLFHQVLYLIQNQTP
jgi:flagellar biosynthetic protein FliQ